MDTKGHCNQLTLFYMLADQLVVFETFYFQLYFPSPKFQYTWFSFQHTLSDLLSKVQASEAELLDALNKIGALEIDGESLTSGSKG